MRTHCKRLGRQAGSRWSLSTSDRSIAQWLSGKYGGATGVHFVEDGPKAVPKAAAQEDTKLGVGGKSCALAGWSCEMQQEAGGTVSAISLG